MNKNLKRVCLGGLLLAMTTGGTGCGKSPTIQTTDSAMRDYLLSQTDNREEIVQNLAYRWRQNPTLVKEEESMKGFKDFFRSLVDSGYSLDAKDKVPTNVNNYKTGLDEIIVITQANAYMGNPVKGLQSSAITSPTEDWDVKYSAALQLLEEYKTFMPAMATQVRTLASEQGINDNYLAATSGDSTSAAIWASIIAFNLGNASGGTNGGSKGGIGTGDSSGYGGVSTWAPTSGSSGIGGTYGSNIGTKVAVPIAKDVPIEAWW